jgi:chromosome segregation ATPase
MDSRHRSTLSLSHLLCLEPIYSHTHSLTTLSLSPSLPLSHSQKINQSRGMRTLDALTVDTDHLVPPSESVSSPTTTQFRVEHAAFVLPSQDVSNTFHQVMHGNKRVPRTHRALSWNQAELPMVRFAALLNDLVTTKRRADDMSDDLKLAAEIGQKLLEKNVSAEEALVQLKFDVAERDRKIKKMQRLLSIYKKNAADLSVQVQTMSDAAPKEETYDDFEDISLNQFLQDELTDTDGKTTFVGDVSEDLIAFRRKLRRERRKNKSTIDLLHESVHNLNSDKEDADAKIEAMKEALETLRVLQAENEQLRKERDELMEKMQAQHLDHLESMRRKQKSLQEAEEERARLRRRLAAVEKEYTDLSDTVTAERQANSVKLTALSNKLNSAEQTIHDLQHEKQLAELALAKSEQREKLRETGSAQVLEEVKNESRQAQLQLMEMGDLKKKHVEEIHRFQSEILDLKRQRSDLEQQLEDMRQGKESAEAQVHKLQARLFEIEESSAKLQHSLSEYEDQKHEVEMAARETANRSHLEERVEQLELNLSELETIRDDLEDQGQENTEQYMKLKAKYEKLQKDKFAMQVKMMVMSTRGKKLDLQLKQTEQLLRQKDAQLEEYRDTIAQWEADRESWEQKYVEANNAENKRNEAISSITKRLNDLMQENWMKTQENSQLRTELQALSEALKELEEVKSAKDKYKEMGKKMLATMRSMDRDMKDMVQKLEEANNEIKALHKQKRRLLRELENTRTEREQYEAQFNKLMKICISQG